MAEPICEDEGLMQEWTPLTQLLQQIPLKTQRGLFYKNLNLTCVDVVPEFIALGTNMGFLYWYCRATGDLQRLRLENYYSSVTCVKIMPFVDYMVAAGTNQGTVIVFQIPKVQSGGPQDEKKSKQKQMERFTVNGLHQSSVTCIEWDTNEMKVFSGDKTGGVVLTEINLSMHISKSMELLNEQFEIVQLSYRQNILLISTVYRSIICDCSNNWKVNQVGTKERKTLGKFGAALCKFSDRLVIFASRPGHRLWLSDENGIVQQTLIFKSAVQSNCPEIQLINPIDKKQPYDTSFGKVIQFGDNKLVTYNSEIMYVLHPGAVGVVSVLKGARKILDLAVNENEIFILEEERSLLRIGVLPDKYSLDMIHQPVSRRTSFNLDEFAAKLKDTAVESIRKITKDLIPTDDQTSPSSPPAVADEALELPPVVTFPSGLMPSLFTGENSEPHSSVPAQNSVTPTWNNTCSIKTDQQSPFSNNDPNNFPGFSSDLHEEIVTRPLRKRRNKKTKCSTNSQGGVGVSDSRSDTASNLSEDRLVCGVVNELSLSEESAFSGSQSSFSVLRDLSSLLNLPAATPRNYEAGSEEMMKTSDTKSQTSLDTCESVSERLLYTAEPFREEQEKVFARLADHSLFDSYNSEKTDNMSISLNLTTSSSVSSKISENIQSPSYASENSEVASRVKSTESQITDNFEGESQSPSKSYWRWNSDSVKRNSAQEDDVESSSGSSLSHRNSQKEIYSKWPNENQDGSGIPDPSVGISAEFAANKSQTFMKTKSDIDANSDSHQPVLCEDRIINGSFDFALGNVIGSARGSEVQGTSELSDFKPSERFPGFDHLCGEVPEDEDKKGNEFLLSETLRYGPPSESSMLSSEPSSDFTSIPIEQKIPLHLAQDSFDHWPQYKTPKKITSLAVSKNYVICTDSNDRVYYSHLSGLGPSWKQLDYKASMVRVSSDGSTVWILNKNVVSALINPSSSNAEPEFVENITQDIKTFAIDTVEKDVLLVTLSGKMIKYSDLTKGLHNGEISCDFIISDVACLGGVVLAVSNDRKVLCKLPEEDKFTVVKMTKPAISLALGPENLLWVVDEDNNIFFSDDYLNENPHWWQIQLSDYIFQNSLGLSQSICNKMKLSELRASLQPKNFLVATNENSVWIYNKFDSVVSVNKTGFMGYLWNKVFSVQLLPNIQWQTLCAGGAFENKGRVWLLSSEGDIFCTIPGHDYFQNIPGPCEENILCMASSVETLWVLSESGRIYSRLGLSASDKCGIGISWKEMKSLQIDNLRFVWISCGTDVAWACDIHGRTFMSTGSTLNMAAMDPTWVEVEGRPKDVQFEKVFVGSRVDMVWAIDSGHNLYVREGIFPHYQIGTNWVYVCGIEAVHITISGTHVWALTSNGNIYRRCGVSESNFIGDYWRRIPGNLKVISSSFEDELWGIGQDNKILQLSYKLMVLRSEKVCSENEECCSLKEDVTWEIVK